MSFQLMTDTTSDLSFEYYETHDICYLGLTVTMNGKEYHTEVKGEIENDWFLKQLQEGAEPVTSQINVGQFFEFFSQYAKENKPLLYLAFSSGLSGTYHSAVQARTMVLEEYPNAEIRVVDTKMAANGEGLIVDRAVKLRDAGKSIEEVETEILALCPYVRAWFTVDDLHHLVRGGRVSKAAAVIGSLVNIKPILDVDPEGKLRPVGKVRGRKKSLKTLADNIVADLPNSEEQTVFINYSGDKAAAEVVKEQILAQANVAEVLLFPLGPTIATHTGVGCVAVFAIGATPRV
ncbi:EDD domain protein, DegV family [Pilibacter termitis]|uniref:EDD domain protein, DegV family n=1 Tax=Pilibacter termitis TaxID=263852 RepID=A0A1T4QK23_9ENTE|nr:DegV family protein [Pilibacter termitis]SKA04062.1 EDD domain protein, DegV family [Pilibacter termitis]